jgi:hypothetical protein
MPAIPELRRLRQKDSKKAILGYVGKICLTSKQRKKRREEKRGEWRGGEEREDKRKGDEGRKERNERRREEERKERKEETNSFDSFLCQPLNSMIFTLKIFFRVRQGLLT